MLRPVEEVIPDDIKKSFRLPPTGKPTFVKSPVDQVYTNLPNEMGDATLLYMLKWASASRKGTLAVLTAFVWMWIRKVLQFIYTVNGGRCEQVASIRRNVICNECEKLKKVERPGHTLPWLFCSVCGCWDWLLAHIPFKNRLRYHHCSMGKFPRLVDISTQEKQRWLLNTSTGLRQRWLNWLRLLLVVLCLVKLSQYLWEVWLLPLILIAVLLLLIQLLRWYLHGIVLRIPMRLE